jgi:shikimate dehydrogenase
MTLNQISLLKQRSAIDPQTRLVGCIGQAEGAWSPLALYNAAFDAARLNWRCVPLSVARRRLREALMGLRALGFVGAVLGEEYQRDAVHHVEQISPEAEMIGAVNFVSVDGQGRLAGDNSRWFGFLAALRALPPSLVGRAECAGAEWSGLRPLIIGAGNAARSIVYALTREGVPLTIVDERMDQAVDLVHLLRRTMDEHSFGVYRWPQDAERLAPEANLIVNTTDSGVWPDGVAFPADALVVDLVSRPAETRFMHAARASGAAAIGGLSLLVFEAARAFEKWTGHPAPVKAMQRVAGNAALPEIALPENLTLLQLT